MFYRIYLLAFLLIFLSPFGSEAWEGKVVRIIDGDTFIALKDYRQIKVRLAEVNAPERGRPWSGQATEALKSQIAGKIVQIEQVGRDDFGRVLAIVWVNDTNINAWMLQNGHAWVKRKYMRNHQLLKLEQSARENKVGLWSLPDNQLWDALLW